MIEPVTGSAGLGGALDAPPRLLEARALLGQDQAAVLVLLGEDEGVDLFAELDLLGGVHGLADRELVVGDDPLALVPDVDEDLVLVDAHNAAGDDVPFLEGNDGRVVVGKDLTIDLDQHPVGALDDPQIGRGFWGQSGFHERRDTVANMPVRATKRGADRTPLSGDYDVLICGASFAGLAVARELRATGARVLVLDRYEIGERQTSACAAPTAWLHNLGVGSSIRQTFDTLVVHTPGTSARWPIGWDFSTFDYPELCRGLWDQHGAGTEFETAKIDGRKCNVAGSAAEGVPTGEIVVNTDRGDVSAPLIVDGLGWRRVLGPRRQRASRRRRCSRAASRSTRPGTAPRTSSCGSTRATCAPATAGRSRPAARCGSASARSTRVTTSRSRPSG